MKKVDKIFLVDDDSIANFVNQHIIKWLEITDELRVISSLSQARQEVHSLLEKLDGECMAKYVILINSQMDAHKQLLPSHLVSHLPIIENESLLIIMITYNRLNDPMLIFHIEGVLSKPVTRENLLAAWQKFN